MKSLYIYITESQNFKLTDEERASVLAMLGFVTGNLGEDDEIKKFEEYKNMLSDDEKQQLDDLYDLFDDEYNWPVINRNIIRDDIHLLCDFLHWVTDNDLWGDCEYDGLDAFEKIQG